MTDHNTFPVIENAQPFVSYPIFYYIVFVISSIIIHFASAQIIGILLLTGNFLHYYFLQTKGNIGFNLNMK